MTIDEAIKHAEEVAEENSKSYEEWLACKNRGNVGWSKSDIEAVDKSIEQCKKCAEEHRQLVEWLKELKAHREAWTVVANAMKECSYRIWHEFGEYVGEDCEQVEIINLKTALGILEDYRPKEGDAE